MRAFLLVLGMTLIAGCTTLPAGEQGSTVLPLEPTKTGVTQPEKPGSSQTSGIVIEFRRSGGFAGVDEAWTIYSNGRITSSNQGNTNDYAEQVPPEKVEALLGEIEALGFFEMTGNYIPLDTCCDRFTYEVIVHAGEKSHRVSTIDAAPEAPPELWQVIEAIRTFMEQGSN